MIIVREADDGEYADADEDEITIVESFQFNFDIVRAATNDFSNSNKLGQGGFGVVYRVRYPFQLFMKISSSAKYYHRKKNI